MKNWADNISLDEKALAWIKHLSRKEIQKIVAEKFEYFSSLIKYSKNSWLTLRPFQANDVQEWTFACWLWEEWNKVFSEYMEWKIEFSDIPEEYFEPKYLYYWLPWLISKQNDVLWPIIDHELEHAESSDYWDILVNSREAVLHNLPVTMVGMFFNAFEDIYMGKKQIAKWRAKKLWVQNLYKDMFPTTGTIDKRSETLKLDQFAKKALFYWLNKEFPSTFDVNYVVDEDVQEEFDNFINHLDEIVDVNVDNKERIKKKNDILWPIIDRLWKKDMDKLRRERIKQQIQQERKEQQQQQVQKTQENTQEELKDTLNQQQWSSSEQQWSSSEQQWSSSEQQGIKQVQDWAQKDLKDALNNKEEEQKNSSNDEWWDNNGNNWNWQQNNQWDNWWEWNNEPHDWQAQNGWSNSWESQKWQSTWWDVSWTENQDGDIQDSDWNSDWETSKEQQWNSQNTTWNGNYSQITQSSQWWNDQHTNSDSLWRDDPQLEEEIEKRLQSMSDEETKQMIEEIKNNIDAENLKEHWDDLRMQKKLLESKKDWEDSQDSSSEWKDSEANDKREAKEKKKLEEKQQKELEEMQKQWEKIEKAVEKRQKELGSEEEIGRYLDQLEEMTHEKDFNTMEQVQRAYEDLMERTEKIESDDVKERVKEKIKAMSDYLKKKEKDYEDELRKSWFSKEEEYLYKRYMELEKELDKDVDRFIRKLEAEIPKLKEYHLEWWYTSWRVTDMNEAWRKVRLKQRWAKLYSRLEEKESLEVNLWICLSIDVSGSMHDNMGETMKLVIFLWLLCQKWWIPFHVNTFGESLNIIKDTDDDFEKQKWKLMRDLIANDWYTNISLSAQKDLDVIKEVKDTHPDTVFLPIFITDWWANAWITWDGLIELMKWFKWLSTMVGIGIDEQYLKQWYPDSKVIWLKSASEIMTVLLRELKQFFKKHKTQIFKVITE